MCAESDDRRRNNAAPAAEPLTIASPMFPPTAPPILQFSCKGGQRGATVETVVARGRSRTGTRRRCTPDARFRRDVACTDRTESPYSGSTADGHSLEKASALNSGWSASEAAHENETKTRCA